MNTTIINTQTKSEYAIELSRTSGELQMNCPICSSERKNKQAKSFTWNVDKGVGMCHHCGATFVTKTMLKRRTEKTYTLPEWGNKTDLTDNATKWFEGRMISQNTLRQMRISSASHFIPQVGAERNTICFPYFRAEQLVNCKYRDGAKNFTLEKNAELIFYNFNAIADNTELIITEGEMDALSFIEAGFNNVVSVPNGAGGKNLDFLDNYISELEHITKFYIAVDFDSAGLELREELVRRLGSERCWIATFNGCKDANELLCSSAGTLQECIANAKELPMESVVMLSSQYDAIYDYYLHGLSSGFGLNDSYFDSVIRWDLGLLVPVSGIPSHGKSEFLDFLITKLNNIHGWKAAYFSPENNPVTVHHSKLSSKIAGMFMRPFNSDKGMFDEVFEYIEENFFWLDPNQFGKASALFKQLEQLVKRKGIKTVVLDPFNCIDIEQGRDNKGETETQAIGRFLYELQMFARKWKLLIFVVAHPAKPPMPQKDKEGKRAYPVMSLYDIAGSAHWFNRADIGLVIQRDFETNTATIHVQKVRHDNLGQTGEILLQYDRDSRRYHAPLCPDKTNWLHPPTEEAVFNEAVENMYAAPKDKYECPF